MLLSGDTSKMQRQTQTQSEKVENDSTSKQHLQKSRCSQTKYLFVSDKIIFKVTKVVRDKDGHFIIMKEPLHQKDITILNIYAPNRRTQKYTKQILTELKREADTNTIIFGGLNAPLLALDRSSKQKINEEILALNDTLKQIDIIDIYRALHSRASDHAFFSSACGALSRNTFKRIEIITSIFCDQNPLKLEINYKRDVKKPTNMWI